ncbi:hypothetical protein BCR39DRAFT_539963 [Naematelia encephala]|uniref:RWD domain-containing protein n=1 Tax=Naematelia encephala TaxID=71784 RepID=A0A1Y2AXD8_9TREE|nr:hypothetical protein BCR39DRAFT_539963 [Naematelia encephala]
MSATTIPTTSPTLADQLLGLTFPSSPPPALLARFAEEYAIPSYLAGSGLRRGSIEGDDGRRSPPEPYRDPDAMLNTFIQHLLNPEHADTQPNLLAIGYELEALLSMYPGSVKLCVSSRPSSIYHVAELEVAGIPSSSSMGGEGRQASQAWTDAVADEALGLAGGERIRYEVTLPAWEDGDAPQGVEAGAEVPRLRVLVSLPPTYPDSSPPQLQLLGRYVGNYGIDAGLFGDITRTYITSSGVPFASGDVCVFEGLNHVQSLVRTWYASHLSSAQTSELERKKPLALALTSQSQPLSRTSTPDPTSAEMRPSPSRATFSYTRHQKSSSDGTETPSAITNAEAGLPVGLTIISSDPIHDRKSTFVGHAIRVTDEREVPLVIHELLSDKKIAKAAHPAIFAYRIVKDVGGVAGKVINSDYDDDGESAAGARLSHLLEILELENVLVVVTRWFGGTLLGSDRFKHISQAAREALEAAGFLDEKEKEKEKESGGGNKRRGKR